MVVEIQTKVISPNTNGNDESTPYNIDFLSQGFKIREDHDMTNGSGDQYIYFAFAELPFKFSNGSDKSYYK